MILVTGATGGIGRHLVKALARDGVPFRALVRNEARGREPGCDFTVGDLGDLGEPASITAALDGVDRLFLTSGGALPVAGRQPMVRQQIAAADRHGRPESRTW
ncbi:SDR family oxidoreductase [Streptomyces sp. NPDC014894]|uniref:SDR family oxidoreductase n=1 Tax=Streptomyces sp. NPDC014894 TaxID=3364931 RepID=UPI0036FF3A00